MINYRIFKNGKEIDAGNVDHLGLAGEKFDDQVFTKKGEFKKGAEPVARYDGDTLVKGDYSMITEVRNK